MTDLKLVWFISTLTVNVDVRRGVLYHPGFTTVYLRARGLGVMMSPSHGEDREFKSLRAHSIDELEFICDFLLISNLRILHEQHFVVFFATLESGTMNQSCTQ